MQFHRPILFLFVTLLSAVQALAQSSSNGIAAVVQGKPISKSEVRDSIKASEQVIMYEWQRDPVRMKKELAELHANALDSLIDRELVLIEFTKIGGTIKPQFVDDDINSIIRTSFKDDRDAMVTELAKAGMSMKKFREMREKMLISNVMQSKQAGEPSPATPREVDAYYKNNVDKWRVGDQIKISTITIPKFSDDAAASPESQKKLAQDIRSKLLAGANFATTARSYSQDSRAEFGGAWEWMPRTDLTPTIANAAMELKPGGISQIIEQETSYIIVACDAKKLGEAPPLEKIRGDIQKMIQQQKSREAVNAWMETLRKKAVIKKF